MMSVTRFQAVTYLFGVCLFSISFLVFMNSSISFVITDVLQEKQGVGNAVGTLGFLDELVALVACPVWGVLSDRIGVRTVSSGLVFKLRTFLRVVQICVLGYAIVGLSLVLFVQAKNIFPQLLLARLLFSVGGSATATMVTAILPSMIATHEPTTTRRPSGQADEHILSPPLSPEHTIIPIRSHQTFQFSTPFKHRITHMSPTRLAGFVGLFTGFGALLALGLFLPLPAIFQKSGVQPRDAVVNSYFIVGAVSAGVSAVCFFGLRDLPGEEDKALFGSRPVSNPAGAVKSSHIQSSLKQLIEAVRLGFIYPQLGLGYLGGFVARASSVGISLFIPLFVNAYFLRSGVCNKPSRETESHKTDCREAYVLAAKLTGVSQLVALLFAPVFGYIADKDRQFHVPLLVASLVGILGYLGMSMLESPETGGPNGSPWIFLIVAMLGISQIGAIVCSLGLVGHGVLGLDHGPGVRNSQNIDNGASPDYNEPEQRTGLSSSDSVIGSRTLALPDCAGESTRLLGDMSDDSQSYRHLKGSIAGVYSLSGGAGILLLTKLGGLSFDDLSPVAPFCLLGLFNTVLFIAGLTCGLWTRTHRQ